MSKLTPQQRAILEAPLTDASIVVVNAYAGTGKTRTLAALAAVLKRTHVYISFNVAVADSSPVQPATTLDALNVAAWTDEKDAPPVFCDSFTVDGCPDASVLYDTINAWASSDDASVTKTHVPTDHPYPWVDIATCVVEDSFAGKRPITHALLQAWVTRPIPYDVLLVDEAQDLNPRQVAYLLAHKGPRIFIGDPHQSIYGFRGANDRMRRLEAVATARYELTQTFRFGPPLTNVVHALTGLKLTGTGKTNVYAPGEYNVNAFIARTQLGLFQAFVAYHERPKPSRVLGRSLLLFTRWLELASTNLDTARGNDLRALELIPRGFKPKQVLSLMGSGVVFSTVHSCKGLEFEMVSLVDDFRVRGVSVVVRGKRPRRRRLGRGGGGRGGSRLVRKSRGISLTEERNLIYVAITRARQGLVLNTSINSLDIVQKWISPSSQ